MTGNATTTACTKPPSPAAAERFESYLKETAFWLASLLTHGLVFLVLAMVITSRPKRPERRIVLAVEQPEVVQIITPPQHPDNLGDASAVPGAPSTMSSQPTLQSALAELKPVELEPLNVLAIYRAGKAGSSSAEFGGATNIESLLLAPRQASDLKQAVDQFAIETLNAISQGPTLVVLLIDESRSVVNKDLPVITERMDHYFKQIRGSLRPQHMDRGKWVVFSYGRNVSLKAPASADLGAMRKGLTSITPDVSGKENVLTAVNAALERYGKAGFRNILIAALTDERGTDTQNDALLESTIKSLRKHRARFFVFGREAVFCRRRKRVTVTIGNERLTALADGGPESPELELWSWQWHHWQIPSGFGMYGLNRIVQSTEGVYFLIETESAYDERKLYGLYAPDICSRAVYRERMAKSALRRRLAATWRVMDRMHMRSHFRHHRDFGPAKAQVEAWRSGCREQAEALLELSMQVPRERGNWYRWQAHAQVTAAELLRRRYLFGQYALCLAENAGKFEEIPDGHEVLIVRCNHRRGGRAAVKEFEHAKSVMELAFRQHRDTPWETLIRRMSGPRFLFPGYTLKLRKIPEGGKRQRPYPDV